MCVHSYIPIHYSPKCHIPLYSCSKKTWYTTHDCLYILVSIFSVSPEGGVSVTPVGVVYDEGDTVTFLCSAEGGPGNTLQWLKDGEPFSGIISGSENNLTLTNITIDDGAVYTCVASNAAGTGSASVSLNISPVIILHPVNIGVTNGTNTSFTCAASAFPEPTYVWIRVGGELPESAIGVTSSTLMLSPAVFGDQGEYYCSAISNVITVSSNTATLTSQSLYVALVITVSLCLCIAIDDTSL